MVDLRKKKTEGMALDSDQNSVYATETNKDEDTEMISDEALMEDEERR